MKTLQTARTGKKSGGFTLVELIVVIAILAVLAAIAIAGFSQLTRQARISQANSDLNTLTRSLNTFNSLATAPITRLSSAASTGAVTVAGGTGEHTLPSVANGWVLELRPAGGNFGGGNNSDLHVGIDGARRWQQAISWVGTSGAGNTIWSSRTESLDINATLGTYGQGAVGAATQSAQQAGGAT
jgi:prepilin-type N-terminal cleavage/methylation domain-containing protein